MGDIEISENDLRKLFEKKFKKKIEDSAGEAFFIVFTEGFFDGIDFFAEALDVLEMEDENAARISATKH